jgi:DNA-binding transcriptional regulator YiaG
MLLPMTIGRNDMKDYKIAKRQIEVSVGESVRIIRELQELSQNELARMTGIPQSTISANSACSLANYTWRANFAS